MELAHLRLADRHIAEGEVRISDQVARVEKLQARRYPVAQAEEMLELLRTTMVVWHQHRNLILAALSE